MIYLKLLLEKMVLLLYRGFGTTLIQAFPLHGTIFMVYELWKDVMKL